MRLSNIILTLTLSLILSVGFVSGQEITQWSETGWVDLFNGKDLSGWRTTGNWIVKDGVITLHPREGEKGWQRYDAYLTSEKTYGDFVLEVDFKFEPEGNSGVFLRVGDLEDHVTSGMEIQILDTHHLEKPGNHDCGGIIRTTAPFTNAVKPAGAMEPIPDHHEGHAPRRVSERRTHSGPRPQPLRHEGSPNSRVTSVFRTKRRWSPIRISGSRN